jgi:putative ABC transport system substrate-binding protein
VAILLAERQRIFKLTLAHRWVVVAGLGGWAEATALRSYSVDNLAHFRRAAYYVDRILKGAKPCDLPIQEPI